MQETLETRVQSLGWEDPLVEEMAIQSSILAWKIPWTVNPEGLQCVGSQSDMTERLNAHTPLYSKLPHLLFFICTVGIWCFASSDFIFLFLLIAS